MCSKDDPLYNIRLVKIIEQYPCLYDSNTTEYGKREITENAWATVGHQMNDAVAHCKEKWKNLRSAFSRSINKQPSGSDSQKRTKDYYLKEAMQFIRPFLKKRTQIGDIQCGDLNLKSESQDTDDNSYIDEAFVGENLEENILEDYSFQPDDVSSFHSKPSKLSKKRHRNSSPDVSETDWTIPEECFIGKSKHTKNIREEADKCVIDYIKHSVTTHQVNNPDLEFFKSLLPDIAKMSDYQKRQFKRRTLEVIDSILCDGPSENTEQNAE